MCTKTPGSDPIYKRLYAFREMVADLLRSTFPGDALGADYGSLERLPAEYVGDDYRHRRGDSVWRLRARAAEGRGGWLHVLVLLEFQSKDDRTMAVRVLEYTAMLYRELIREQRLGVDDLLPPVLPVVLYNGDAPWRSESEMRTLVAPTGPVLAPYQPSQRHIVLDERHWSADDPRLRELTKAVVLVEQSQSPQDLLHIVGLLLNALGAGREELAQAFADWLSLLWGRLAGAPAPSPPIRQNLQEMKMTLEERVGEWHKPYVEQGREEGMSLGREEGLSRGREEGMRLARQEAVEQQRQLLRGMAAVRFGAMAADGVARALANEPDPERLAEVGKAIARCATSSELLQALEG